MARTFGAVAVTDDQIREILQRIPDGITLKQSCKLSKVAYTNIIVRISASDELKKLHAHAREEYVRTRVQEMHDIAKNSKIDPARARLMIDVIKWEAARVIPKEFGDRVQQEVTITNNTTLSQRMAAARTRTKVATALPPVAKGEDVSP